MLPWCQSRKDLAKEEVYSPGTKTSGFDGIKGNRRIVESWRVELRGWKKTVEGAP